MDEFEYDEGSDIDNWEAEQVFQDHEGHDDEIDPDDVELLHDDGDTDVQELYDSYEPVAVYQPDAPTWE